MDALTAPLIDPFAADKAYNIFQNVAPSWGNYLYQNVLPNLGTDWLLNANLGNGGNNNNNAAASPTTDLFSAAAAANAAAWGAPSTQQQQQQQQQPPMLGQPGPSNYYMNYYGGSIAPSLLAPSTTGSGTPSGTSGISPSSLDMVDKIVASPSPMASAGGASPTSIHHHHPRRMFGRTHSVDSDADGEVDPEAETRSEHSQHSDLHDHDEGVERDGMIWGMKVDEYRALSPRERKRVRNRISARTFRAKRKEHLSSLESTLGAKDLEIRLAHEENTRLRRELAEKKRRLQKYEKKPY